MWFQIIFSVICNFLRCCKAHHVDIGLHYQTVFKLICRLCNLFTIRHCSEGCGCLEEGCLDFQAFSQTFFELLFSLGNEGKDGKNLNCQTWPGSPRRPSPRHQRPPDLHWLRINLARRQRGSFVKGWFWRTCLVLVFRSGGTCERTPRSGFRSGGTSDCTLVPVFVPGEHPPKPRFSRPLS